MRFCLMALLGLAVRRVESTCSQDGDLTETCDSFANASTKTPILSITDDCTPTTSTFNTSYLTLSCNITSLQPFWLTRFPQLLKLFIPNCSLYEIPWQSLSLANLTLVVDLTTCPLNCSCRNAWLSSVTSRQSLHFGLPDVKHSLSCNFSHCTPPSLIPSASHLDSREGEPIVLNITVSPPQPITLNVSRPYFGWASDYMYINPRGSESVSPSHLVLSINSLEEPHLGIVIGRCWHCSSPVYSSTTISFPSPARAVLVLDSKKPDSHFLNVRGHPLDDLSLSVNHLHKGIPSPSPPSPLPSTGVNGSDSSEVKALGNVGLRFGDGLVVEPVLDHWQFPFRLYKVSSDRCGDCLFDRPSGNFSLLFCQREKCTELVHTIDYHLVSKVPEPKKRHWSPLSLALALFPFVLLAFSVAAFLLLRKRKAKQRELRRRESGGTEETRLEERASLGPDYSHVTINNINLGDIQMYGKIGQGAFGEVFRAKLTSPGGAYVAVKVIKDVEEKEAKEAAMLSRLSHDNIVRLFGSTRDGDRLLLIFEMMELGDLRTYVADRRPRPGEYTQFPPALLDHEMVFIVRQIVEGMAYLAEMGVVHRDLAARNCLVKGESDRHLCIPAHRPPITVKARSLPPPPIPSLQISDFGMSRRLYSHSEYYRMQSASVALPVRWLPPEALNTGIFNLHTDIWALGVTIWEVYSFGLLPFADLSTQELLGICMAGVRPPQPKKCPDTVYDLMLRCWEKVAEERITPQQALLHPALRRPSDDLARSTSITTSISSAWTHSSEAPLLPC